MNPSTSKSENVLLPMTALDESNNFNIEKKPQVLPLISEASAINNKIKPVILDFKAIGNNGSMNINTVKKEIETQAYQRKEFSYEALIHSITNHLK